MSENKGNLDHAATFSERTKKFLKNTKKNDKAYRKLFGDIRIRMKLVWAFLSYLDYVSSYENSKEREQNRESIENAYNILDAAKSEVDTLTAELQKNIEDVRSLLDDAKSKLEE